MYKQEFNAPRRGRFVTHSSQSGKELSLARDLSDLKFLNLLGTLHCVEWARDKFGKWFTEQPKMCNLILKDL